MVDYLGNFDRAVEVARKLGNCPEAKVVFIRQEGGLLDRILGKGSESILRNIIGALNGNVEKVRTMYLLN